jgi:MFS family permease
MAAAVILALPLSPPFALTLVAILVGASLWEGRLSGRGRRWVLIGAALLALAALVLMALAWSSIGGLGGLGAGALLSWWARVTDTWRMGLLIETSPIIGFFLQMFPEWAQMPAITAYGLLLPLLPAALADAGNPVWWTIAVYRALGWTALIPFLLGGVLLVHRTHSWKRIQGYLVIIIAVSALAAAMRASSLQWDNPRYRAVLLTAQMVLAAWAWMESKRRRDPWLKRIAWIMAADLALIMLWYAGRYWDLPQIGLARTLIGLGVVSLGMLAGFLVSDRRRRRVDA